MCSGLNAYVGARVILMDKRDGECQSSLSTHPDLGRKLGS